jgi:hypothetical protein
MEFWLNLNKYTGMAEVLGFLDLKHILNVVTNVDSHF